MKRMISALALFTLTSVALGEMAVAQQPISREEAIRQCVAQAQSQVPNVSGDPSDPAYSRRANIYSACMKDFGQIP